MSEKKARGEQRTSTSPRRRKSEVVEEIFAMHPLLAHPGDNKEPIIICSCKEGMVTVTFARCLGEARGEDVTITLASGLWYFRRCTPKDHQDWEDYEKGLPQPGDSPMVRRWRERLFRRRPSSVSQQLRDVQERLGRIADDAMGLCYRDYTEGTASGTEVDAWPDSSGEEE